MKDSVDWSWKLREAVERIKTRYDHIGRKTGAPFLAIVYPPEAEAAVLKEWRTLLATLGNNFEIKFIDVLEVTMSTVEEIGTENIVNSINQPMAGSNPESELGNMWVNAVATAVRASAKEDCAKKKVIVLEHLAALYPATGPRAVMQSLWDSTQTSLDGPLVVLIPGTLVDQRVYSFVNQRHEFMYRGDL